MESHLHYQNEVLQQNWGRTLLKVQDLSCYHVRPETDCRFVVSLDLVAMVWWWYNCTN